MNRKNVALLLGKMGDESLESALTAIGWRIQQLDTDSGPPTTDFASCLAVGLVCVPDADAGWLERIHRVLRYWKHTDWIAVVSPESATNPHVQEFIASHCLDYQTTPIAADRLNFALGHAAGMAGLTAASRIQSSTQQNDCTFICKSQALQLIDHEIKKIARTDMPVLITGETGSGKELVARSVHFRSERRDKPFVAVNCVSMSPSLIHAELFGFEKGAFTGAHKRRVGHLEAAQGGTIFLDEIGDLDLALQALLLRFLEERTVRRVGGREEIAVEARVVAATHVDLEAAVRQGRFRQDLYYRLNVLRVKVPPLRERPEDIEALAREFLANSINGRTTRVNGFTAAAVAAMKAHSWPGNVRELLNRVRRAVVMAEARLITPADLHLTDAHEEEHGLNLEIARADAEKQALNKALQRAGWNATRAARLVGVSRATFYRLVEKYRIATADEASLISPVSITDMPAVLGADETA